MEGERWKGAANQAMWHSGAGGPWCCLLLTLMPRPRNATCSHLVLTSEWHGGQGFHTWQIMGSWVILLHSGAAFLRGNSTGGQQNTAYFYVHTGQMSLVAFYKYVKAVLVLTALARSSTARQCSSWSNRGTSVLHLRALQMLFMVFIKKSAAIYFSSVKGKIYVAVMKILSPLYGPLPYWCV